MLNNITYIGVDIAKEKFDICIYDSNFSSSVYETYSNNIEGFDNFLSLIKSSNDLKYIRVGMEATSTYMTQLQIYNVPTKTNHLIQHSYLKS